MEEEKREQKRNRTSDKRSGKKFPRAREVVFDRERIVPYLAMVLLLGSGYLVFVIYRSYVWSGLLALLLYVGFEGLYRLLLRIFRGRKSLAASLTTMTVIVTTLGPAYILIRLLILEAINLFFQLKETLQSDRLLTYILKFPALTDIVTSQPFFWVNLQGTLISYTNRYGKYLDPEKMGEWVGNVYSLVLGSMTFTIGFAVNILFGLILLYFLFRDGARFYRMVEDSLPVPPALTRHFTDRMKEIISAVLKGNIFVSILQGMAMGMGLVICDIPNSVLYGSIAAIFSLVPVIGTAVVWLPAALYLAFVNDNLGLALFISIYGAGMYLFLENIFKPLILDKKLGLHPLFLFFAIIGGLKEFGMTGVVLGPLFVTLFITLWSIYNIWSSGKADEDAEAEGDGGEMGETEEIHAAE